MNKNKPKASQLFDQMWRNEKTGFKNEILRAKAWNEERDRQQALEQQKMDKKLTE